MNSKDLFALGVDLSKAAAPMKTMNCSWQADLEMFVDNCSLHEVVRALAVICHAKAERSREDGDRPTGGKWGTAGGALNAAANKCGGL